MAFAFTGLRPLRDPDTWWHLRLGEFVVQRHSVPSDDPFSSVTTHTWVTHEWLAQVLMFLSYDVGGYKGVSVLRAVVMLALALTVARSCLARANGPVASLVTALALVAVWPGTGERPQLVSFLLFALLGPRLLERLRAGTSTWPFVVLIALWSNLHGFWSLALILYVTCAVGAVCDASPALRRARAVRYGTVALAAVAAATVNPNGIQTLFAPFRVTGYAQFVSEWVAPSFLNPFQFAAFALLGLVVLGWARAKGAVSWLTIAYVAAATAIGFVYSRDVPIAAVLLAPLAAESLMRVMWLRDDVPVGSRRTRAAAGVGLFVATGVAASVWVTVMPALAPQAPFGVSARLDTIPGRARVITEYELGAWLLWTARDSEPAIDGRIELYGPAYVRRYFDARDMRPGWRGFVKDGHFDAAWLRKETPLVTGLTDVLGWRVVLDDGSTVVLVPPSAS